jgi:hypothetical protein
MSYLGYKHKTHIENIVNKKSKCGIEDVDFSDDATCLQCIKIDKKQRDWILKENAYKKGMK